MEYFMCIQDCTKVLENYVLDDRIYFLILQLLSNTVCGEK